MGIADENNSLLLTGLARGLELIAGLPLHRVRRVDHLPAKIDPKPHQLRVSLEVPLGIEVVAEVVVMVLVEALLLCGAPRVVMALIQRARVDGERRNPYT